jgi:hypothetical protein
VYRLRQDVAAAGRDPSAFDTLKDVRSLEYEVDYLTNKCKVRRGANTSFACGNLHSLRSAGVVDVCAVMRGRAHPSRPTVDREHLHSIPLNA